MSNLVSGKATFFPLDLTVTFCATTTGYDEKVVANIQVAEKAEADINNV